MSEQLPSVGVSSARIEQLRDNILVHIESLVEAFDIDADTEANAHRADSINALTEAFINLR
jgi:hypothetical protein